MSETNLKFIVDQLVSKGLDAGGYKNWLSAGTNAIVMEAADPAEAFTPGAYVIGANADTWKQDIAFIYRQLPSGQQAHFRSGFQSCVALLNPDRDGNDPSRNNSKNSERLALDYFSMARDMRIAEVLDKIEGLIEVKFPKSQAVYDSALLTWRVMADWDTETDWRNIFFPSYREEPRFRLQYSPIVAFGMCVAQPSRIREFLYYWRPLQHYVSQLAEELSITSRVKLLKIIDAYRKLGMPEEMGIATPIGMAMAGLSGKLPPLAQILMSADKSAYAEMRELPMLASNDAQYAGLAKSELFEETRELEHAIA
jgi:hypothetical protein